MVSSASVYFFAVVAAVLLFGCECQNGGTLIFPDDNNESLPDSQQPFRPRPQTTRPPRPPPPPGPLQPLDTPTLTASVTSSTERPAGNPEVPVLFKPSCDTCPYTPQYNPVCGSDGQTYANVYILKCQKVCGKGWSGGSGRGSQFDGGLNFGRRVHDSSDV